MMKTIFALAGVLCFGAFAVEPHDHDQAAHDHDHAGHDHAAHDHDHAGHGPAAKGVKAVEVAEAVQKAMGLKTVRPEKRRLASTVAFTGRYELSPDARRTVATPVAGRLALLVKPLARVKAGEALFTVTSPDLAARARELAVLERRLDVYRKLGTKNAPLASERAVKKAEREALVGDAEETNGVVTVRAASDGLVEAFPSEAGAWVETGASVVRLVAPEALRLRALVAASDAARACSNSIILPYCADLDSHALRTTSARSPAASRVFAAAAAADMR
ncbi:efflux RND transporter periplasmic adaptor subunit [uncultured Senegalimassilia sp.]|uniref:efflux RND transporter periplasmic adaptor subunit n=1 Tax=uncultured Senegalimassilia sp. TaxID=1714350 RepID=UPI0025EFDE31|nr:efflux RND transporter periplasmic adaptor subunit [uncultured Senegalimassilia sp.]